MNELESSRRWCVGVMREHAKSFFFSTRLLPRQKREAIEALYALFRTADDLADEPGFTLDDRLTGLAAIDRDLASIRNRTYKSEAPWFAAVQHAFLRFPIDVRDAQRLIEGCRSDLSPSPILNFEDLERYAAAVAGTVGRCSMPILGASDEDTLARGERLGIAMQLTNVLRDVEEDRRMGRGYLPLAAFPGQPVEDVMRVVAQRARTYYREARVLAARVPNDGSRAALLVTGDVYSGIIDRLEKRSFNPALGRVHVGAVEKIWRATRCIAHAYTGLATIK